MTAQHLDLPQLEMQTNACGRLTAAVAQVLGTTSEAGNVQRYALPASFPFSA
jgi:hypothetical protein